MIDLKW